MCRVGRLDHEVDEAASQLQSDLNMSSDYTCPFLGAHQDEAQISLLCPEP